MLTGNVEGILKISYVFLTQNKPRLFALILVMIGRLNYFGEDVEISSELFHGHLINMILSKFSKV